MLQEQLLSLFSMDLPPPSAPAPSFLFHCCFRTVALCFKLSSASPLSSLLHSFSRMLLSALLCLLVSLRIKPKRVSLRHILRIVCAINTQSSRCARQQQLQQQQQPDCNRSWLPSGVFIRVLLSITQDALRPCCCRCRLFIAFLCEINDLELAT